MKRGVAKSGICSTDDNGHLLNETEKDEWYKRHVDKIKEIVNDNRFTK